MHFYERLLVFISFCGLRHSVLVELYHFSCCWLHFSDGVLYI